MSYALGESATVKTLYTTRIYADEVDSKSMYTVNGVPLSTEIGSQGNRVSALETMVSELQTQRSELEGRLAKLERILKSVLQVLDE